MTSIFHVSTTGTDRSTGREDAPLRTISRAAELAGPGDTVVVHQGIYREWVRPPRGGLSDARRITYTAAEGEHVLISGAEPVTGWQPDGRIWSARVPACVFGDFNPFSVPVEGDWVVRPSLFSAERRHLGDLYLNGRSIREAFSRGEVGTHKVGAELVDDWTGTVVRVEDPEWSALSWFAEVEDDATIIWADFGDIDPNREQVEVNVRPAVFRPEFPHIDYITVRGFEMAHAATQWAPPTAEQDGLVGPNWARGWIIEDNTIHDSKCVGVSLGKERSSGDNFAMTRQDKPGYQYQLESVFSARQIGWDREHIGSHVVRRNEIFDCGQAGIVGHLGCVFSTIEDNHIHHIALRRQFYGHEIAGIKLHAAIDVVIRHNHVHHCSLGTWLDWETQGTRVTRNVCHDNSRDLFVEVSHGPYVVDDNIFASPASIEIVSQGGAYLHNLVVGTVRLEPVMDRATPYHRPHSTQVAGFALIPGGDDRWIGNIFLGGDVDAAYVPGGLHHEHAHHGTVGYDEYPASFEEYMRAVSETDSDHERYYGRKLPAYVRDNVYVGGAQPFVKEERPTVLEGAARMEVDTQGADTYLDISLPDGFDRVRLRPVGGADLRHAHFPDAEFEEPDGQPVLIGEDLTGCTVDQDVTRPAGPLLSLTAGRARIRLS
jgi:hypothetical protein